MAISRSVSKKKLLQQSVAKSYTKFQQYNNKIFQVLFDVKYTSASNLQDKRDKQLSTSSQFTNPLNFKMADIPDAAGRLACEQALP